MLTVKQPKISHNYDFELIIRPKDIIEEVRHIVLLMFPDFNFSEVMTVYKDIVKLFQGKFIGYRQCNTLYHDLRHTEDCVLVMARLIHGAFINGKQSNGKQLSPKSVKLGLISALMHDTGYIQTADDDTGTGAKYTQNHVERSIDFTENYFKMKGFSLGDFIFCKNCLNCTGLHVNIEDIQFQSAENKLMGKILGTADLIGQMADSDYLEKLPLLFKEFREGGVTDYETEFDLLEKTPIFWKFTQRRFIMELGHVDRYLRDHFGARWGIDRDLSREAIEQNLARLKDIVENHPTDYWRYLPRQNRRDQSAGTLHFSPDGEARREHQVL